MNPGFLGSHARVLLLHHPYEAQYTGSLMYVMTGKTDICSLQANRNGVALIWRPRFNSSINNKLISLLDEIHFSFPIYNKCAYIQSKFKTKITSQPIFFFLMRENMLKKYV